MMNVVRLGGKIDQLLMPSYGFQEGQAWMVNYLPHADVGLIAEALFYNAEFEGDIDPCERTKLVYWMKNDLLAPPMLAGLGTIEFRPLSNGLTSAEVIKDVEDCIRGGMQVPMVVIDGRVLQHEGHDKQIRGLRLALRALNAVLVIFEPLNFEARQLAKYAPLVWESQVGLNGWTDLERHLHLEFDGVLVANIDRTLTEIILRLTLAKLRSPGPTNAGLTLTTVIKGGSL